VTFLDYLQRDTRTARDLMAHQVITATEGATLPQLAELMMSHRVKGIPIMRDRAVSGIVSHSDLVAAMACVPAPVGECLRICCQRSSSDRPAVRSLVLQYRNRHDLW
jgi:CBS-domain-containing membrane protein